MSERSTPKKISIAIADDHVLLRWGIIKMLAIADRFELLFEAGTGIEVMKQIQDQLVPDILLLDLFMPGMDGEATARWINKEYPSVKVLVFSMTNDDAAIVRLIQAGVKGYVTKDMIPENLINAIQVVYENGVYFSDHMSHACIYGIQNNLFGETEKKIELRDHEILFLTLLSQQLSYGKIAERMYLSKRTIHDYSNNLSRKLNVKGKTGLILYAMSNGFNRN